ncbi:hypothetical protein [Micromonospora saelicesensis]|uniref:Uncharacterized protein n=1 Tax=Micromonospora saelicesensis TaxID=285676 RepID=A0A1C4V3B1_9ACTN|nr:hypothetical protein [Micromonospora saelicesensis]SCE78387.1 hypothetical protein GA0070561_1617 [Micromonospora saelicesensis]
MGLPFEPDTAVAHLIAEKVLAGRGEYIVTTAELHAVVCRRLPSSSATKNPAATAWHVRHLAADLGTLGISARTRRTRSDSRPWFFRLV